MTATPPGKDPNRISGTALIALAMICAMIVAVAWLVTR